MALWMVIWWRDAFLELGWTTHLWIPIVANDATQRDVRRSMQGDLRSRVWDARVVSRPRCFEIPRKTFRMDFTGILTGY